MSNFVLFVSGALQMIVLLLLLSTLSLDQLEHSHRLLSPFSLTAVITSTIQIWF